MLLPLIVPPLCQSLVSRSKVTLDPEIVPFNTIPVPIGPDWLPPELEQVSVPPSALPEPVPMATEASGGMNGWYSGPYFGGYY